MAKYKQANKMVGVRLTPESYEAFERLAEQREWSIAQAVRHCAEQYLGLPKTTIKVKIRRNKL